MVFVATLALGLSAAATAAGVVRALLSEAVAVYNAGSTGARARGPARRRGRAARTRHAGDVAALRDRTEAFETIAAFRFRTRMLGSGVDAEQAFVTEATADFWRALDVRAVQGRTFGSDEEIPGHDAVAVVNETFWRERLGGAPVLGRSILIDDRPFNVIGVVAERYPLAVDIWVPLAIPAAGWQDRRSRNLQVVALLGRGVNESRLQRPTRDG